jgi:hypothetical protein
MCLGNLFLVMFCSYFENFSQCCIVIIMNNLRSTFLFILYILYVCKWWMPIACDDPNPWALPRNYTLFYIAPLDLPPCNLVHDLWMTCLRNLFVNSHFLEHLCMYVDVCLLTDLQLNLKPLCCLCFKAMFPQWSVVLPTSKLPVSCFTL